MNQATLDQAQGLTNLLEKQPLAGFLALTILALIVIFTLYVREKSSHQRTLREVLPLMTTFTAQWNRHQDLEQAMVTRLTPTPAPALPAASPVVKLVEQPPAAS